MSAQQLADRALLNLGRGLKEGGYRFITPTPLTHERVYRRLATPLAMTLRDVFGWSMPFDQGLLPEALREELQQADVIEKHGALWRSTVRWSSLDELLFAHSPYPTDQADAVFFGPDSYRFAQVIEAYLQQRFEPLKRVVDIGCGAGVGALVIAKARHDAEVLAVDINPRALRMTAVNAELAGLNNLSVYHSDVLASVEGEFDLIVANPPYMKDDRQRAYRHGGGALGSSCRCASSVSPLGAWPGREPAVVHRGGDGGRQRSLPGGGQAAAGQRRLRLDLPRTGPGRFGEELEKPGYEQVERIAVVALTVTRLR